MVTADRPDIVAVAKEGKAMMIIELTSPGEDRIEISRKIKSDKYAGLVQDLKNRGYDVTYVPIEITARGIISKENKTSVKNIMKITRESTKFKFFCQNMSKCAIIASYFIFLSRDQPEWTSPALIRV